MIGRLRDLRDGLGAVAFVTACILGTMVIIGGLTWAGIEISSALSKPAGNAQVNRDTNSGANQEQASATFHQLHEQIAQYQAEIQQAKTPAPAAGSLAAEQLTALEQTCDAAVQQYNADAGTNTMAPYLPAGFPSSYPYTTCD